MAIYSAMSEETSIPGLSAAPQRLLHGLRRNELIGECLQRLATLDLPHWYLGAGCIAQTIWNAAHGKSATADIADYDIVYFDPDLSAQAEAAAVAAVQALLADLPLRADVKNQARVHLWYEAHFGYRVRAYMSCEDALASWPTTATAIGLRLVNETVRVYTPFDTADLLTLIVRPNRVQITPAIYAKKVARWAKLWPLLDVKPWEQGVEVPGSRWVT